ncbi:MAG: CPBP family intramembrane metalloprotease [Nocardioidaceae bacterium]|nr:CPBP family intramembrane metalloprotease [Nocardioidaceae bacterium]
MTTQQPQPGIAFHRTLERPSGAGWRLVASAALGVMGLLAMSVAGLLAVIGAARALGYDSFAFDLADGVNAAELLGVNLGLALLIPVSGGLVWGLYGVRPRWLSSHRPKMRWPWFMWAVGVSALVWSIILVLGTAGAFLVRSQPVDLGVWAFVAVVLVTTPLQAAGEEYLFRGLLLQALGATRLPMWACCVGSGALFAVAHLQFQAPLFADRFLLGCVLAWLAIRTGGIEAGIAIHTVKNIAVLVPAGLLDEVSDALDPSGVTWIPLIVDAVLLAIAVPCMLAAHRRIVQAPPQAHLTA